MVLRKKLSKQLRNLGYFLILYFIGLAGLYVTKITFGYSNYIIPTVTNLVSSLGEISKYSSSTLYTLGFSVLSHLISLVISLFVGSIIVFSTKVGNLIRSLAYSTQALPIIAIAPIIFIIFGSRSTLSRILISTLVCYFPLLLTITGALSDQVPEVENFYRETSRDSWSMLLKIRFSEHSGTISSGVTGSAVLAVVGSVVAEFLSAQSGVGHEIGVALNRNRLEDILTAVLALGVGCWLYLGILEITLGALKSYLLDNTN